MAGRAQGGGVFGTGRHINEDRKLFYAVILRTRRARVDGRERRERECGHWYVRALSGESSGYFHVARSRRGEATADTQGRHRAAKTIFRTHYIGSRPRRTAHRDDRRTILALSTLGHLPRRIW